MLRAIEREIRGCTRVEATQRKSGEIFENVFTCQPVAILILDNECIPNIVDCNPAAERVFGYGRKELAGQSASLLHANGKVLEQFKESILSSVDEPGFCRFAELSKRRRDGRLFPCDYTVAPV